MAKWWSKKKRSEKESSLSQDQLSEVDWPTLIRLANDISEGDALVADRMLQASSDIEGFFAAFVQEEPTHGEVFAWGFDSEHEVVPFQCFAAVLAASGYLTSLDHKFPLSDILFNFNKDIDHRGIPQLTEEELTALAALQPRDQRQVDLFFNDVASKLDELCAARNKRLLCWDEGSDSYAYFIVTSECFSRWVGTSLHEYHRVFDPSDLR